MPNIKYDNLDDVPADLKSYAKPVDGEDGPVVVNVVPGEKLNEFRENNIKLSQERDELKTTNSRYVSIVGDDPDEFENKLTDLQATQQRVNDGKLTEHTDIEDTIAKRTSAMVESFEDQLKKEKAETAAWRERTAQKESELRRNVIDRAVTDAVLNPNSGARPDALQDILTRAYSIFNVEEGKVIPKNGDATIYGMDGTNPMSPLEWLSTELKSQAGYLFKDSSGGGAGGGKETLAGGITKEDLANMTAQEKLDYANKHMSKG